MVVPPLRVTPSLVASGFSLRAGFDGIVGESASCSLSGSFFVL
jgi:hypothetical protein